MDFFKQTVQGLQGSLARQDIPTTSVNKNYIAQKKKRVKVQICTEKRI
jgi:hypothetical protein